MLVYGGMFVHRQRLAKSSFVSNTHKHTLTRTPRTYIHMARKLGIFKLAGKEILSEKERKVFSFVFTDGRVEQRLSSSGSELL